MEQTIPAEQVAAGDIVVIRPGDGIPVDGVVTEGHGYVDQAAITGESIPGRKGTGRHRSFRQPSTKTGRFRFQASKVGEDTTLAQIIRLVDDAGQLQSAHRPPGRQGQRDLCAGGHRHCDLITAVSLADCRPKL